MAPLQRRALLSLVFGVALTCFIVLLFLRFGGVEAFGTDTGARVVLSTMLVATIVLSGVLGVPWKARGAPNADVDERDLAILRRAPHVQLVAVMLTMAGWAIGLTEYYWEQGVIPIHWPYLMMWSVLIAITLAQSLGVLIGYWRSDL